MFRIKICGVTSAKDAQLAALAGADAIGLNFFPQSKRFIDVPAAEKLVKVIPPKVTRVGIFVNATPPEVIETADRLQLGWIQLHGDEPPEFLQSLVGRQVIRAFRLQGSDISPVRDYLARCEELQRKPDAFLLDVARPGEFGGTGHTLDWKSLAELRDQLRQAPLILAGGLTPFNVTEAIASVRPDAVDVASGVESKPGTKDLLLVRAFVTSAKKALVEAGIA